MSTRTDMLNSFYGKFNEDDRLTKDRQGQLEFLSTMHYIHKFTKANDKIIEIGAGTGRYSISLAKEGFDVTAVELVESNLNVLKDNSKGIDNIRSYQGDATDLSRFNDETFDVTLVLGPLYHLYDKTDINKAIDEAIRITKKNGIVMFAYLSVYAIMMTNYLYNNWQEGIKENFTADYEIVHKEEQLFTGYDVKEFNNLFIGKNIEYITTAGIDGILETAQRNQGFGIKDEDFESFVKWHINFAEKEELLGNNSHLLFIAKKK